MGTLKNLIGQKFGMLTVLYDTGKRYRGNVVWYCQCDCGGFKEVVGTELARGNVTSCGCKTNIDLTGQKFGRLTAIKRDHKSKNNKWFWLCECSCGKNVVVPEGGLKFGSIKSCGCLAREKFIERNAKHGLCNTRIYKIWSGMKSRCNNTKNIKYKNYGGRGIKVYEQWQGEDGFINFYNWSMKNGYTDELTIDRIDVNGNYCPENCRWADNRTQQNNRRDNVYINVLDNKHTITEWSELLGIPKTTIANHLNNGKTGVDVFRSHIPKHQKTDLFFVYIAARKIFINDTIRFLDSSLNKIEAKFVGVNKFNHILFEINGKETEYEKDSILYVYDN